MGFKRIFQIPYWYLDIMVIIGSQWNWKMSYLFSIKNNDTKSYLNGRIYSEQRKSQMNFHIWELVNEEVMDWVPIKGKGVRFLFCVTLSKAGRAFQFCMGSKVRQIFGFLFFFKDPHWGQRIFEDRMLKTWINQLQYLCNY